MRRSYLLVVTAVIVGALSTVSLLAGIRRALGKRETVEPELPPREAERRRIREALGDMLAPPISAAMRAASSLLFASPPFDAGMPFIASTALASYS